MKVAFAYIDPSYQQMGPFHVGIASLVACLLQEGHDCCFLHLTGDVADDEFAAFVEREHPGMVAFSLTANAFPHAARLASLAKQKGQTFNVCGGVHATLCPDEVIAVRDIDAVCIGEGEGALLDLCNTLEAGGDISVIPNLWVKGLEKGELYKNDLRPLIEDLDSLPFPDRRVFPFERSFDLGFMKRGVFMGSRGCPYNCTYCCSPAVKQLYGGRKYIRFRSPANLIDEVERVTKDFPQAEYHVFHDDLLPMDKGWFAEFTRLYRDLVKLPFEMNCHPGLMDRDIARMAREAGCSLVRFGIESGNEHIRRKVLERHIGDKGIIDAFACCDEAGIQTLSYNMVGLPYETRGQMLDTVRLNARVRPAVAHVSVFYPYPGTKAYEVCRERGWLTDRHTDSYYEDSVLSQPSAGPEQVRALRRRFDRLVRLYAACGKMPPPMGAICRRLLDVGLALRLDGLLVRLSRASQSGGDAVYTIEGGAVKVWGAD